MIAQSSRWLAIGFALTVVGLTLAAPPDDPFSDANAAKPAKVEPARAAAPKPAAAPKLAAKVDKTADLVRFESNLEPKEGRRGQTVRLTITGTPKEGYHTFPLTQRSSNQGLTGLNKLIFNPPPGIKVLEPVTESDPELVVEKTGDVLLEFLKPFTWAVDLLVLPEAPVGNLTLPFTIKLQACDEHLCVPGTQTHTVTIPISTAPAVPLTAELEARLKVPTPQIKVVPVPEQPTVSETPKSSFWDGLLVAMGAGFLMLLTPCVFPMIPVTVSFFLKQGEKSHNSPFILATVYSGTIVLVVTLAVLLLGNLIITLANDDWFNLVMGAVLMFFALSLFGMFELELPHFLTRFTSAHEGPGYIGAFFMALTFTINSFTCTGPFLGPLLGAFHRLKMSFLEVLASALAYSIAFAAPFFFLALFPRLLKTLPKSGGWLNVVKVVMGFIEVALALKFFAITDATFYPGQPRLFNWDTVVCAYIALAICCGLYLLGSYRLPHDTPSEHLGVPRLLMGVLCLALALYMTPLLWRRVPLGTVGEFLASSLPVDTSVDHLDWSRDYETAWKEARESNKQLFIDFTGVNCQNCRWNEQNIFTRPEVRSELAKFVRVQLYTDVVPETKYSRGQAKSEAARNMEWQQKTFNDVSLPLYVVLDPTGGSNPLTEDDQLNGKVKGLATGTINNVAAFVDMLKKANSTQVASSN